MRQTHTVVVLTERWCLVHNTRTSVCSHIRVRQDTESPILVLFVKVREKRLIFQANEVFADILLDRLDFGLLWVLV